MVGEKDTIVAIATPPGEGGIGIVRLSGPQAGEIGAKIFAPRNEIAQPWPSHKLLYGSIQDPQEKIPLDDGLATRMEKPHTYTGEEVVEVQAHGSQVTLSRIVEGCLRLGARLAEPGEFTKRAFLAGKMDLVQAEAVAELIASKSEAEAEAARRRLEGKLSQTLEELREKTVSLLAEFEADVDFPEEEIEEGKRSGKGHLFTQIQQVTTLLQTSYETTRRLHGGFRVALVGRPNVGKSSLYNALLAGERAIVTAIPGTTRDVLQEELLLSGRRVKLFDTAGLRSEAADEVERIGMKRAMDEVERANLIWLLVESPEGMTATEEEFLAGRKSGDKVWRIWNKIDLGQPRRVEHPKVEKDFLVSAKLGEGINQLREELSKEVLCHTDVISEGGLGNERQKVAIDEYLASIKNAEGEWKKGSSPEFAAFELRKAHENLSRMVGKDDSIEDVLGEIFAKFCIGK